MQARDLLTPAGTVTAELLASFSGADTAKILAGRRLCRPWRLPAASRAALCCVVSILRACFACAWEGGGWSVCRERPGLMRVCVKAGRRCGATAADPICGAASAFMRCGGAFGSRPPVSLPDVTARSCWMLQPEALDRPGAPSPVRRMHASKAVLQRYASAQPGQECGVGVDERKCALDECQAGRQGYTGQSPSRSQPDGEGTQRPSALFCQYIWRAHALMRLLIDSATAWRCNMNDKNMPPDPNHVKLHGEAAAGKSNPIAILRCAWQASSQAVSCVPTPCTRANPIVRIGKAAPPPLPDVYQGTLGSPCTQPCVVSMVVKVLVNSRVVTKCEGKSGHVAYA